MTLLWTLLVIGWLVTSAVVILLQRRSSTATMAWLLALAFMPLIGLIVYRLFGPLRLERKRLRRLSRRKVVGDAVAALGELGPQDGDLAQLARVATSLGEAPPLRARDVQLLTDGRSTYAAIVEAIRAARHHVHLEYYIWTPDTIGTRLRDLLVERARAGVQVRLVLDAMGAKACKEAFLAPLRAAGAEVVWFNPVRLRGLRLRRPDFRTHRKIVVCDGRVGFTGGMNVTDAHSEEFGPDYWRDTHLRVDGAAVWALQRLFLEDFYFAAERLPPIGPDLFPPVGDPAAAGAHVVQVIGSGPDTADVAIQRAVFTAIGQAQRRLWVTTPYFVPDEAVLTALVAAGLRRVDVRLVIPARGDSKLVDLAARSYLPELLSAGVRVYEYGPRFIHAKTMVVDDDVAIVGTANLDNRSFRLNFELVAVVYGAVVNAPLAAAFEADLRSCRELSRRAREPFFTRLGQAGARLLSPLL